MHLHNHVNMLFRTGTAVEYSWRTISSSTRARRRVKSSWYFRLPLPTESYLMTCAGPFNSTAVHLPQRIRSQVLQGIELSMFWIIVQYSSKIVQHDVCIPFIMLSCASCNR